MPDLSVIIPVYKTEPYLRRCLDSVLSQTLRDIEVICVDDASPDGSRLILYEYAALDSRVKLILLDVNGGVSAARNKGMEAATGRWLGFVDSDDFVEPDYFQRLVEEGDASASQVVKGKAVTYNPETGESGTVDWLEVNPRVRRNKAFFTAGFFTAIYRADLIKDHGIIFPVGMKYFEESCFVMEAVFRCSSLSVIDDAVYHYVLSPEGVTRKMPDESILDAMARGSSQTLAMLEREGADKEYLTIAAGYIFSILMMFCSLDGVSSPVVCMATDQMAALLDRCPDSRAVLVNFFCDRK